MTTPNAQQKGGKVECAGCRQSSRPADLERFVFHDTFGLVYDMRGGAPGEEVFVHPLTGCLSAAAWSGFSRKLGRRLEELEADELVADLRDGLRRRLEERLREAVRLGEATFGVDPVRRGVEAGDLEVVVVAEDADSRRVEKFREWCEKTDVPSFEALTGDELGAIFSRDMVAAVGVSGDERGEAIGRDLEKILCIEYESDS